MQVAALGRHVGKGTAQARLPARSPRFTSLLYEIVELVLVPRLNKPLALTQPHGISDNAKKNKKIEGILTKFSDQRLCKESRDTPFSKFFFFFFGHNELLLANVFFHHCFIDGA